MINGSKGNKILDGLRDAVAGNFSAVTIEGERWVKVDQDFRSSQENRIFEKLSDCSTVDFYNISPEGVRNLAMLAAQAVTPTTAAPSPGRPIDREALIVAARDKGGITHWEATKAVDAILALTPAIPAAAGEPERMARRPAYWTHDDDAVKDVGHLYYFAPTNRAPGPYLTQRHVSAIIDIANDGTLAGVELIEDMPPPPAAAPQSGGPSRTAPASCTACHDESDCGSVDVCRAVEEVYAQKSGGPSRAEVLKWIDYADKLERVIAKIAGSSVDQLTVMHARQGLQLVEIARPGQAGEK